MAPEKAKDVRLSRPGRKMKAQACEGDFGHHGSNSRRKLKWYHEEEMDWKGKKSKNKRNSWEKDPRTFLRKAARERTRAPLQYALSPMTGGMKERW